MNRVKEVYLVYQGPMVLYILDTYGVTPNQHSWSPYRVIGSKMSTCEYRTVSVRYELVEDHIWSLK